MSCHLSASERKLQPNLGVNQANNIIYFFYLAFFIDLYHECYDYEMGEEA